MSEFVAFVSDHVGWILLAFYLGQLCLGAIAVVLCLFYCKLDEIARLLKAKKRTAIETVPATDALPVPATDGARV